MNRWARALVVVWLAATLSGAVTGCSSCRGERFGLSGGKIMDDDTALDLLQQAEASGKLPEGLEIEHYVGGGLPPPHYRSEQLRMMVREGRLVYRFVTPDFTAKVKEGESYPRKVYEQAATPEDVRTLARLVRESKAFGSAPPAAPPGGPQVRDRLRTELLVKRDGREAKRVYPSAEPPELVKLRAVVDPLIARLKTHGKHWIER